MRPTSPSRCLLLLALPIAWACEPPEEQDPPPTPRAVELRFEGELDPASGRLEVAWSAETPLGLVPVRVHADGVAGRGPTNTVELVTLAVAVDSDGTGACGAPRSTCAEVEVRSFYRVRLTDVVVQLTRIDPLAGHAPIGSDPARIGLSNRLGLWGYGDLAPGAAATRRWVFEATGSASFRIAGRVLANLDTCGACAAPLACGAGDVPGVCGAGYVRVSAGSFLMGSPPDEPGRLSSERQHAVTLTRDFWIKTTEVTRAEWFAVMGTQPAFQACADACPQEGVSWEDAIRYLNALSARAGVEACYSAAPTGWVFRGLDCRGYRLPTEAEWEYATRAGTTTAFFTGPIGPYGGGLPPNPWGWGYDPNLDVAAWYSNNASGVPHPVGRKLINPWGLYDVHGNVFEWVNDGFGAYPEGPVVDPLGVLPATQPVFRGCSFIDPTFYCRAAFRWSGTPTYRDLILGFRPARTY